jgi:hypothetical protein
MSVIYYHMVQNSDTFSSLLNISRAIQVYQGQLIRGKRCVKSRTRFSRRYSIFETNYTDKEGYELSMNVRLHHLRNVPFVLKHSLPR